MDPITVFLSMNPMYKIISLAIWGIVGFTIHLILKTLKKPKQKTTSVKEPIETILETDETALIEHKEVKAIPEPLKIEEPSKPHDRPMLFHPDDLPTKKVDTTSKTITSPEPKPMRKFTKPETDNLRPYQREGIQGYTRKALEGPELELDIKRKAEELTKEEAWSELSKSFWDTRREGLKQFHPEIYEEIRYWETHLDEYNIRIGLMSVFGIPFGEYDLWVRRRKERRRKK